MSLLKKRPSRYTHDGEPELKDKNKEDRRKWVIYEMIPASKKYTLEQRLDVLTAYMTTGSINEASNLTGIPYQTIHYWIKQSKWWPLALRELRIQKDDELDSRITGMMDKVTNAMMDRIENGEYKLTKTGDIVRVPISFRDLAVAGLGVSFDKRQLIRGAPTQRVEHVNEDERLKKLQQMFEKIQQPKIIDGEVEVIKDNELKE